MDTVDRKAESKLLIRALGSDGPPQALSPADWERLAKHSVTHGVAPLLHRRLETAAPAASAPPAVRDLLRAYYLQTAVRNARLYHGLAALLRAYRAAAVDVIVLKGALLAEVVYGNVALRSMGDIDLLVRRSDLSRARDIALEKGYVPLGLPSIEWHSEGHQLTRLLLGELELEIHWNIEDDASPFAIDPDRLWEQARPVAVAGVPALMLSPEDLLLHLCLHTTYNHGSLVFDAGLRSFSDIAEVIRRFGDELDWEALTRRARAWGVEKCTYVALRLAAEFFEAEIPGDTLRVLKPEGDVEQRLAWARDVVLSGHYSAFASALPTISHLWLYERQRRTGGAVTFMTGVFPSRRNLAACYPSLAAPGLIYLSYPARWRDLLIEYGRIIAAPDGSLGAILEREKSRIAMTEWLENLSGSR